MDEAAKYLAFRIARENNFTGTAEWLEPDAPQARTYERDILYSSARYVNDVIRALTRQEMTDWRFLYSITEAKGFELDGDHDWAWRLVVEWMGKHGFLDDLAVVVEQHYLPPDDGLLRVIEKELDASDCVGVPTYDALLALRDACAVGDMKKAARIIGEWDWCEAISNVSWRVQVWLDGLPTYED